MIGDIPPPEVAAEQAFGDVPHVALFPDEGAVIAKAVDKRRREFATAPARDGLTDPGRRRLEGAGSVRSAQASGGVVALLGRAQVVKAARRALGVVDQVIVARGDVEQR